MIEVIIFSEAIFLLFALRKKINMKYGLGIECIDRLNSDVRDE